MHEQMTSLLWRRAQGELMSAAGKAGDTLELNMNVHVLGGTLTYILVSTK
jgi:hypothetical protein